MSIVPLIIAAFGVAAVAGSSSKTGGGGRKLIPIRLDLIDKPSGTEKFADALYYCGSNGAYRHGKDLEASRERIDSATFAAGNKNNMPVPNLLGYEYLASVERTAAARVAAMRNKISSGPRKSSVIAPMAEDAAQQMWRLGQTIIGASKSKAGRVALANRLGVPVADINRGVDGVVSLIAKYGSSEVAAASRALIEYSADYVAKLVRDLAVKLAAEVLSTAAAKSVAEAIPIIGQIIEIITKVADAMSELKDKTFKAECEGWVDQLKKANADLIGYGYPIPWHLFDVWSPKCREPERVAGYAIGADRWTATREQDAILVTLKSLRSQWGRIPAEQVEPVTKWWTLASAYMSNDQVKAVFETMCIDSLGGTIASDEQVMVVAAPIAVANGLDVDAFARELWKNAHGWADSALRQNYSITRPKYKCSDGFWASGCDIVGSEVLCSNTVLNCFVLNLVDLCAVAFPLAQKMKKSGVGLRKSSVLKIDPKTFESIMKSASDALKGPPGLGSMPF